MEINALAIVADSRNLPTYFEVNVITGPDAFVMEAADFADFADALQRKLAREISPRVVSGLSGPFVRRIPQGFVFLPVFAGLYLLHT